MCLAQGHNIVTPYMIMVMRGKLVAMIGANKAFGSSISSYFFPGQRMLPDNMEGKSFVLMAPQLKIGSLLQVY